MGFFRGGRLGSRILRFGATGADVCSLHKFLEKQGYDLGKEKHYGYLTQDAVRHFQREHRLVPDGIAGPRFFALVLEKNLPIRRRIHVVKPRETLSQIAEAYGVGPQAFIHSNRVKHLYPGQRLVFFDREIWGLCNNPPAGVEERKSQLTGLISSSLQCGQGLPLLYLTDLGSEDGELRIHRLLQSAGRRKKTVNSLLEGGQNFSGIYLPWQEVATLDGGRYLNLLKRLRRKLRPEQLLLIELGPGVSPWKIWGGLDYGRVNQLADRIVLSLPVPAEPGPILSKSGVEALLGPICDQVYPWKILLRLPVFGVEWVSHEGETAWTKLPYAVGLSRAFRFGARLEKDERGALFYRYQRRDSQIQIRLPQYNVFEDILVQINLYNLAGIIVDQLGMEDARIWQILTSCFRPVRLKINGQ